MNDKEIYDIMHSDISNELHRINLYDLWYGDYNSLPEWSKHSYNVIYVLVNKINYKKYVGQAIDFLSRWRGSYNESAGIWNNFIHQACYEGGDNAHRYNAIRKYGVENFDVVIVDAIGWMNPHDAKVKVLRDKLLNSSEQCWIDYYHTFKRREDGVSWGYNENSGGDRCEQLISEETINKSLATRTLLYGKSSRCCTKP